MSLVAQVFLYSDEALDLSRDEAAEWLSERGWLITKHTLENLAWKKKGPLYTKWGKRVTYAGTDLRLWAEARVRKFEMGV